jgi:hypothetical protein
MVIKTENNRGENSVGLQCDVDTTLTINMITVLERHLALV